MAGTTAATGVEQLQGQRKGAMAISLTDFGVATVSQIAEGSGLEIAGAWVDFIAAESMGANWAAMAVGDVYARIDSVALTSAYTATAPTWNTELQGYYDATNQYKYYAKLYKDVGANYLQKALYTPIRGIMRIYEGQGLNTGANADQLIRFANDCRMLWDESETRIDIDKDLHLSSGNMSIASGTLTLTAGNLVMTAGNITFTRAYDGVSGVKKISGELYSNLATANTIYDTLSPYLINIGDEIEVKGLITNLDTSDIFCATKAKRTTATRIDIYCADVTSGSPTTQAFTDGLAGNYRSCLTW